MEQRYIRFQQEAGGYQFTRRLIDLSRYACLVAYRS
jgi:hypothetical protein